MQTPADVVASPSQEARRKRRWRRRRRRPRPRRRRRRRRRRAPPPQHRAARRPTRRWQTQRALRRGAAASRRRRRARRRRARRRRASAGAAAPAERRPRPGGDCGEARARRARRRRRRRRRARATRRPRRRRACPRARCVCVPGGAGGKAGDPTQWRVVASGKLLGWTLQHTGTCKMSALWVRSAGAWYWLRLHNQFTPSTLTKTLWRPPGATERSALGEELIAASPLAATYARPSAPPRAPRCPREAAGRAPTPRRRVGQGARVARAPSASPPGRSSAPTAPPSTLTRRCRAACSPSARRAAPRRRSRWWANSCRRRDRTSRLRAGRRACGCDRSRSTSGVCGST